MPTDIPTPQEMEAIRRRLLKIEPMQKAFKEIEIRGHFLCFTHRDGRETRREVKLRGELVIFEYPLGATQTARISVPRGSIFASLKP